MARSKKDILDTEKMLERLIRVLYAHRDLTKSLRTDAEAWRRISMTLHNWHELECGTDRGHVAKDAEGKTHFYSATGDARWPVPDREAGALKRLKKIMSRYPSLQAYVQGDPRGCALYILKPGDVPEGERADVYYSRGLAVFK
jgi:hypothetical protein